MRFLSEPTRSRSLDWHRLRSSYRQPPGHKASAVTRVLAVIAAVGVVAAACGGSSKSAGSSEGPTYTIGVLTDVTGPGASVNRTTESGIKAGTIMAKRDGYTIKYVVADTETSPATVLSAAQELVEVDHVLAIVAISGLTFAAAPYLTSQGVPVVGAAEDGTEWIQSKNMFASFGPVDTTKVSTTYGKLFKMAGATTIGSLGYSVSPTSAEAAKGFAASAQDAGLKVGYLNASFPFGGTNVQPEALAMKNAGVNGMAASVEPNTGLLLISALRQLGVDTKIAMLPTAYGGDITQAGPGAIQAAQGAYFVSAFEPLEMNTPATRQFQADLKTVGVTAEPTYAQYQAYTSMALLIQGLKGAGAHANRQGLIQALSGVKNFNAAGLLGNLSLDMSERVGSPAGVDNCLFVTKLVGTKFEVVPNAEPLCGSVVPGKTVSASS
jgi:branched-chain amino acid transport system substrate-binding protein